MKLSGAFFFENRSKNFKLNFVLVLVLKYNRPFAASHSQGTKLQCWRAKFALGQDK